MQRAERVFNLADYINNADVVAANKDREFTLEEQLALVYNTHNMPIDDKVEELRTIAEEIDDEAISNAVEYYCRKLLKSRDIVNGLNKKDIVFISNDRDYDYDYIKVSRTLNDVLEGYLEMTGMVKIFQINCKAYHGAPRDMGYIRFYNDEMTDVIYCEDIDVGMDKPEFELDHIVVHLESPFKRGDILRQSFISAWDGLVVVDEARDEDANVPDEKVNPYIVPYPWLRMRVPILERDFDGNITRRIVTCTATSTEEIDLMSDDDITCGDYKYCNELLNEYHAK